MSKDATCRVCGKGFRYGGRTAAPAACALHIQEWRAQVAATMEACRPWQDSQATIDALLGVLPADTADAVAWEVADAMRALPPDTDTTVVLAVTADLQGNVRSGRAPTFHVDQVAEDASRPRDQRKGDPRTARNLLRFGVPESTAYRKAREGMRPAEAMPYAMRRIARLLETDRRMREGAERATARRGAARRFPRPQE